MTHLTIQPLKESPLRLVHALPGRVRLRATSRGQETRMDALAQQLRQQGGVYEVRINKQTGSLLATFNTEALPLPRMLEVLQRQGISGEPEQQPRRNPRGPLAVWKSGAFWKAQGRSFIPLFAGLLVTQALRLRGWQALLVYIITANTINQTMNQLEPDTQRVAPAQPL